jgi:hypothetical protein
VAIRWFRHDKEAVVTALRAGLRPLMATSTASGPLDEFVALHFELGIFDALDAIPVRRQRAGIDDRLLLRTLMVLPFVSDGGLDPSARLLFQEPAVLMRLGWAAVQIQSGDNHRHRHPDGRRPDSLPCHPDTLRDAMHRVEESAWRKLQEAGVAAVYERRLVRGRIYAIDGTGLGNDYRLVCLVCVSSERPVIVAWRLLEGAASEKGREAAVTRELVEQALRLGGSECIELLLADALYADGPLIAWLAYEKGIDILTPLPADRRMYADAWGLADSGAAAWARHRFVQTIRGHKQSRTIEVASVGALDSWDSFVEAARGYGAGDPSLYVTLIREIDPPAGAAGDLAEAGPKSKSKSKRGDWALVSTRRFRDGWAAYKGYRGRWQIENDGYRELKEGFGLERWRWGRDAASARCRVTLTLLAFNTIQIYRSRSGERAAGRGIRRLRRAARSQLGRSPVAIFMDDCYGVMAVEELLDVLGATARQGLLPLLKPVTHPPGPT